MKPIIIFLCGILWLCGQQANAQLKPSSRYAAYTMETYNNDKIPISKCFSNF